MALPYANASSGDKALGEIQKLMRAFECDCFGTMTDWTKGTLKVQFVWKNQPVSFEASFKGYAAAHLKDKPYSYRMRCTKAEYEAKALEIGSMAVYSILRDWIRAQVTAVETGLVSFEEVFLAHMMLPNGERFIDHVKNNQLLIGKA